MKCWRISDWTRDSDFIFQKARRKEGEKDKQHKQTNDLI